MNVNYDFHQMLYQLAERPRTASILTTLLSAAQPYARRNIQELGGQTQADADHRAIIDAIAANDAATLVEVVVHHPRGAECRLKQSYS